MAPSDTKTVGLVEPRTHEIALSAGTIEYQDTGGEGPAIVLLSGLLMDASLWDHVVAELDGYRCIAPTLPLGAHRHGMDPDADLSPRAMARLVVELLERLDLDDVTLVGNDTGGALVQLVAGDAPARVGRIALVSCDAFDNFPPGLTGRTLVRTGKLPPALFGLFMQQMRLRPLRRLPLAFGWLTVRGDATTAGWIKPVLSQREIRRDTVRVLRARGCAASTARHSSCGRAMTASCRPSTAAGWPSFSRSAGSWRYPTATRSSRSTSRRGWPRQSGPSPAMRPAPEGANERYVGTAAAPGEDDRGGGQDERSYVPALNDCSIGYVGSLRI